LRNIGTFRCGALIDPVTLTFDLLTLKSVWESHVTWGTPVQSFVFVGLLVFELEPMYATSDRQADRRTTDADDRLMPPPPPLRGGGIINVCNYSNYFFSYYTTVLSNRWMYIVGLCPFVQLVRLTL